MDQTGGTEEEALAGFGRHKRNIARSDYLLTAEKEE